MSKPEFSKPFNILDAKAGAPYCCRDGHPAQVLKWDRNVSDFPLLGVVGKSDDPRTWVATGASVYGAHGDEYDCDLVMLPLGYIDGKPVFVGDEIETKSFSASGAWEAVKACPGDYGFSTCRWPAPAPMYPVTRMQMKDFDIAIISSGSKECVDARAACAIANAAISHALIDGDVVLPDTAPSDDMLMKVAKEVYCRATGQEHFLNEKEQYFRAIIASVTGAKDAQPIDPSIKKGDMVYRKTWGAGKEPVEVVDINWALKAIAVKLSPTGGTIVWPISGMTKEFLSDAKEGAK